VDGCVCALLFSQLVGSPLIFIYIFPRLLTSDCHYLIVFLPLLTFERVVDGALEGLLVEFFLSGGRCAGFVRFRSQPALLLQVELISQVIKYPS